MREERGMRAQAAILDSMMFMLMCSAAAALLFLTAGNYASTVNREISAIYGYEWMRASTIAIYYSKDEAGDWALVKMRELLADVTASNPGKQSEPGSFSSYFANGAGKPIWDAFAAGAPSANATMCFSKDVATRICPVRQAPAAGQFRTVYTYATVLPDKSDNAWTVTVYLPYA